MASEKAERRYLTDGAHAQRREKASRWKTVKWRFGPHAKRNAGTGAPTSRAGCQDRGQPTGALLRHSNSSDGPHAKRAHIPVTADLPICTAKTISASLMGIRST